MPACGLRCLRMLSYCASGQKLSKWSNFMPIFTRAGEYQRVHLPRPQLAVAASETRRKKPVDGEWMDQQFLYKDDPIWSDYPILIILSFLLIQILASELSELQTPRRSFHISPGITMTAHKPRAACLDSTRSGLGGMHLGQWSWRKHTGYSWTLGRGYGG